MATVFFDSEGLLLVDIMPHGTTINSDGYVATLKKLQVRLSRIRRHREKQDVLLLHDNAQPYVSHKTTDQIRKFGKTTLKHSPYSPELAPCDYHLFGKLKDLFAERDVFIMYMQCQRFWGVSLSKKPVSEHLLPVQLRTVPPNTSRQHSANHSWQAYYVKVNMIKNMATSIEINGSSMATLPYITAEEPREFNLPTIMQRCITYVPEKLPSKYGVHSEEYLPICTLFSIVFRHTSDSYSFLTLLPPDGSVSSGTSDSSSKEVSVGEELGSLNVLVQMVSVVFLGD
ncbi:hypothetical protein ANN_01656 [Periplaneta americana]|uniref:Mariner Mos1 transposase n=1 Tax=Periplaneta americana TaxID=6978 RepID=A0ABQ8TU49_PERAM|nr:hypothetical protein ANN_01656 [Periplaneta americana]